jgi:hypothetical protein
MKQKEAEPKPTMKSKPKPKPKVEPKPEPKPSAAGIPAPHFFFPIALIFVFILIFSVIFFKALSSPSAAPVKTPAYEDKSQVISITTDKAAYMPGDKITLEIGNGGKTAIYLEPCKDIGVFEKKDSGEWVLKQEESVVAGLGQSDFEKKSGNTQCQIDLPQYGPGTYRVVLPVYSSCTKPSRYACSESRIYHSGEFEVLNADTTIKPAAAVKDSGVVGSESSTD